MTVSTIALSSAELVARTSTGELAWERIARDCLARVEAREPIVKAWSFLDPDLVLRQARALDARPAHGPLHGVPVGVKDVIETADMPTQMGSSIYGAIARCRMRRASRSCALPAR